MALGGRRPGAGRPKGAKDRVPRLSAPQVRAAGREFAERWISKRLERYLERLDARAMGLSYLVVRDPKTGKFVRVTRETLAAAQAQGGGEAIQVWEKEPCIQALREALDRLLGRPDEYVEHGGSVEIGQALEAARQRARARNQKR